MTRLGNLPCAIYTRKSSEEGLEQDFNSLHAQREACEAFIKSQQHEGWKAVTTRYDDGGFSGGTLERPALKRLLADLAQQRIKVVVVYKVDRLTRSLADFAKIVEQFDALGVSFVSVTQQFNTTSSMGRLTLNVLLSFAQFEREVTGERIRDKIAASKKKGLWMGGITPLGYQAEGRKLIVDPEAAPLVQRIFDRYLALGSVRTLKSELDAAGIRTPARFSATGRRFGNQPLARAQIYRTLSHPVYRGQIVHHDQAYDADHPPLIDEALWNAVQAKLAENKQGYERRQSTPSSSLLTGRLFDAQGHKLIPSHSQKQSKRYRYYVSASLHTTSRDETPQGLRLPAAELESAVVSGLQQWLTDADAVLQSLNQPPTHAIADVLDAAKTFHRRLADAATCHATLQALVSQVSFLDDRLAMKLDLSPLCVWTNASGDHPPSYEIVVPVTVQRCGLAMRLTIPGAAPPARKPDQELIALLGKAHRWKDLLTTSEVHGVAELAAREGVTPSYAIRVLYRACLAPDIVRAILAGTQPPTMTAERLKHAVPLPLDWQAQRVLFGFPQR